MRNRTSRVDFGPHPPRYLGGYEKMPEVFQQAAGGDLIGFAGQSLMLVLTYNK
jgi:hypothetical protein